MVFDYSYIVSKHAIQRILERKESLSSLTYRSVERRIIEYVENGSILLDTGEHRYIQYDDLFFPCVKIGENAYKVKTVLVKDMVEARMQSVVDKYNK